MSARRPREYSASSAAAPSVAIVAAICGAEILGLAGFSIVPALLPQFIAAWSLTNTQAGWLAGIPSAGYMLAVIPLVSLTDRRPARQLYLASSVLSALSCFRMALFDPASGARGIVRDTRADGAYRFHWSVIPPEEPLPIAAGRTGGLARARSIAEQALRACAADFRMQTEVTCLDPPILDTHPIP